MEFSYSHTFYDEIHERCCIVGYLIALFDIAGILYAFGLVVYPQVWWAQVPLVLLFVVAFECCIVPAFYWGIIIGDVIYEILSWSQRRCESIRLCCRPMVYKLF